MTHTLTEAREGRQALRITAGWAEISADYEDVLAGYRQAAVPGFRPGKAAPALIEKRFRKELREDFTARCGRRLARQALGERDLRAAGPLAVVEIAFEPRREFAFTVEYIPLPKLALPDYFAAPLAGATDDERRDELTGWLLDRTDWNPPEELVREECERDGPAGATPGGEEWQSAAQRVKLMLILEQIAEAEGIEADGRDTEVRIAEMAAGHGVRTEELRRELGEEGLQRLQALLRAEQTLEHLLVHNDERRKAT